MRTDFIVGCYDRMNGCKACVLKADEVFGRDKTQNPGSPGKQKGARMSTIHLHQTTTSTPEQYIAGLTDFGPGRPKLFGNSADEYLKVHHRGPSEADVTEGSGGIWERLHYDLAPGSAQGLSDRFRYRSCPQRSMQVFQQNLGHRLHPDWD